MNKLKKWDVSLLREKTMRLNSRNLTLERISKLITKSLSVMILGMYFPSIISRKLSIEARQVL